MVPTLYQWQAIVGQAQSRHQKSQLVLVRNDSSYTDHEFCIDFEFETLRCQVLVLNGLRLIWSLRQGVSSRL